ncbi:MAG: hypothetical protein KatS3mg111_4312 [Pirellulaceae bacterium]|nr:MAG: hypothetical protein KatS3mg111_4312 [Pirellulaceae bacterium]
MLRKLLGLFASGKPFVPPTEKQVEYAKLCGVTVQPDMDREAVSRAIDAAFVADPKLKFKVSARRKRSEKQAAEQWEQLPAPLKREFKKWQSAADEHDHFVIAYSSGRNVTVDILECDGVRLEQQTIIIDFLGPRIENVVVGYDGRKEIRENELCWDQKLSLRSADIKESRKIQIFEHQVKKYQSTIKRTIERLQKSK